MNNEKQRAGLGFGDELDNLDTSEWTPKDSTNDRVNVDTDTVRQVAEREGFTSREVKTEKQPKAKPKKEPTDQINIRTKVSTIEEFKGLSETQEPKWPLGYTLERALAALKRELEKR